MGEVRKLRYVDLSGYAFTGKQAVIDLVREFKGFHVPRSDFEFNLIRIQGGIRDLETALVDDWSPIRSDAAIRHFRLLIDRMASKNSWLDPSSWFRATGWNYEEFFGGEFRKRSNAYVAELVDAEWVGNWPYPMAEMKGLELFTRKLMRLLRVKSAFDVSITLSAPTRESFLDATRRYLEQLLVAASKGSRAHSVVMHNTFEPFNPGRAIRYFDDARCIIVDRDPCDNYVDQVLYRWVRVTPEVFVKRYRMYRQIAASSVEPSDRVLRLHFESLILDHARALQVIMQFLGVDAGDHVASGRHFNPRQSAKNVGIWRAYPRQDEIEFIRRELSDYCRCNL